ncbi:type II toxin-antitoxin system RelE/ParE family toxin [Kaistella antarctica]|uniref:Plasmid stabilisation system protein n=1 Tax=Kaistella antarctica TaxID=266748 RepID=A0A3S4UYB4_9FLAO|nr:type II toxin-antitoxin system RelE/ParE family toxin [Kaistella antarctica]KEY18865.1 hypothetical protein HY04_10375 [Kaistella antarctica]SEW14541.1 toxin YoeB [Kaistella antarctica]VEH99338.1 Plasmid stabilisation system protein [Kaistella antarctica]
MLSIKWTEHAKRENADILKFWIKHNQSNVYSKKISKETTKKLSLLKKNILMGEELEEFDTVRRILILENFSLFYTIEGNIIKILSFWDNRRNPENLEI